MNGTASDREIQECLQRKDFEQADVLIRARLEEEPGSADGHYLNGVLKYMRGQLGPAIDALRKSLSIDSRHTDAAICLSVLYNDIGKYDEARKVFEQANHSVAHKSTGDDLGIDRKFAVKHMELADLYFRYRRYDAAIEEYAKAAMLDPVTLEIRIRLAKAYAKKGFVTRAMQELQQLKREHPHFAPARLQLGLLHYSQGNVLDAELEWEGVVEVDALNREAHAYLEMAKRARIKG